MILAFRPAPPSLRRQALGWGPCHLMALVAINNGVLTAEGVAWHRDGPQ